MERPSVVIALVVAVAVFLRWHEATVADGLLNLITSGTLIGVVWATRHERSA